MNLVWDPVVPMYVGSREPLYITVQNIVDCLEMT